MSPSLAVVADNDRATQSFETAKPETVAQRVKRLQSEAKALAKDHVQALVYAIASAEALAAEIAEGGEAYPPGVRDLARRFAEEAGSKAQTLEAISGRT